MLLARMLQVSGVDYCASGTFLGMAYFDLVYLPIALVVATRVLVMRQLMTQSITPTRAGSRLFKRGLSEITPPESSAT